MPVSLKEGPFPSEVHMRATIVDDIKDKDDKLSFKMLRDSDLIIATEEGRTCCSRLQVDPHLVLSDHCGEGVEEPQINAKTVVLPYSETEGASRIEFAVNTAFELGAGNVAILAETDFGEKGCATEPKYAAVLAKYPGKAALVNSRYTIVAVTSKDRCTIHGDVGRVVTLIPYADSVEGLRGIGFLNEIDYERLEPGKCVIKNEIKEDEAALWIQKGILLLIAERSTGVETPHPFEAER